MKITVKHSNKMVAFEDLPEGMIFQDPLLEMSITSKPRQWLMKIPAQKNGTLSIWTLTISTALARPAWFGLSMTQN